MAEDPAGGGCLEILGIILGIIMVVAVFIV